MELQEAIRHALDGKALLFTGAGFSFGAKNAEGHAPKTARAFAGELYKLCNVVTDDDNLMLASQTFLHSKGERGPLELLQLCKSVFTIRDAAAHHETLLSLPWQRIYTTNYDDLAERAALQASTLINPVTLSDQPENFLSSLHVCVHINGLVSRLTQKDLLGGFKLTAASYLVDEFNRSPWSSVFRQDLQLARAIIFVGYSMYDLDIQRIVHSEDTFDKTIFITSPSSYTGPDTIFLPTFGSVFPIGVEDFAKKVEQERRTYVPRKHEPSFLAIEHVQSKPAQLVPTNSDIEKLFLYGITNNALIGLDDTTKFQRPYVVERTYSRMISDAIIQGDDAVVIADLGNGKTILLEQVMARLSAKGWNVFRVTSDSKDAQKEALDALSLSGETVFVIDNYISLLEFIKFVSIRRTGKPVRFLLSARSHVHEAFLDRLEQALHVSGVAEFDVNRLDKEEVRGVTEMIDAYGLWADFSAQSDTEKSNLITRECGSQFHQILLKIYKSPNIAEKIKELFGSIRPHVRKIAIAAFLIRGSGILLDRRTLDDLLKGSPLIRLSNSDRESVKFLWSDVSGQIRLRSSVLAEFYLTGLGDAGEVVDVLTEMYFEALDLRKVNARYMEFIRSVMSFSALQKLLPESGLRPATIRFYEAIQNTDFTKDNPHYWLQYAIARLSFNDDLAEIEPYFRSAYVYAKESNWDTFQIDNHYARFLLLKAVRERDTDVAFGFYAEARGIIQKQILREEKHYPYRVAAGVADFFAQHSQSLSDKQREDILRLCGDVLLRIEKLPYVVRNHGNVISCRRAMQAVLDAS